MQFSRALCKNSQDRYGKSIKLGKVIKDQSFPQSKFEIQFKRHSSNFIGNIFLVEFLFTVISYKLPTCEILQIIDCKISLFIKFVNEGGGVQIPPNPVNVVYE